MYNKTNNVTNDLLLAKLKDRLLEYNPEVVERIYTEVFNELYKVLSNDPSSRVYLPNIGVIYTDIIHSKEPGKYDKTRFRLSSKPRRLKEPNGGIKND